MRRRVRASAIILTVAAALGAVGLARADAGEAGAPVGADATGWIGTAIGPAPLVYVDGDHVVFEVGGDPVDAKGTAVSGSSGGTYHDGFATYGDATLLEHYEVRLVSSAGIERVRPHVAQAVASASAASGQSLELRPGTVSDATSARGHIDIVVSDSSPCSGMWLGCGGPTIDDGKVVYGRVWINPRALEKSTAELDNIVRHEFGHTLGLAHYEYLHEDRVQTMHPTRYDAANYESGDIDGLRFVAGQPPVQDDAPPVRSSDPVGLVESAVAGPFGLIVRGWAVDPDTTAPIRVTITINGRSFDVLADGEAGDPTRNGHGFSMVRLARAGTYEVCATARNVGDGADEALGCQDLRVSGSSVGSLGLQTV